MQQVEPTPPTAATASHGHPVWGAVRRLWMYILMLVWAIAGLAYTDLYPLRSVPFWQATTVLFAGLVILRIYLDERGPERHLLALKQLAHWGAFLGAMLMLHSHFVTDVITGDPLGIVVLLLLALATFLDGVYVDWRFCIVGLVLAIGVILVAVIDDASIGIVVLGVLALAALYGFRHFSFRRAVQG